MQSDISFNNKSDCGYLSLNSRLYLRLQAFAQQLSVYRHRSWKYKKIVSPCILKYNEDTASVKFSYLFFRQISYNFSCRYQSGYSRNKCRAAGYVTSFRTLSCCVRRTNTMTSAAYAHILYRTDRLFL